MSDNSEIKKDPLTDFLLSTEAADKEYSDALTKDIEISIEDIKRCQEVIARATDHLSPEEQKQADKEANAIINGIASGLVEQIWMYAEFLGGTENAHAAARLAAVRATALMAAESGLDEEFYLSVCKEAFSKFQEGLSNRTAPKEDNE